VASGLWTAYLNNFVDGGDATAIGAMLMKRLGIRLVVGDNSPKYGPGHQATQLWVLGPDGDPPLMYRRTIAAHATDGRWTWDQSGVPFDFEHTERYSARRIRDRFDRPLLVEYLEQFGISADDDAFYGDGILVQQRVTYATRTQSLLEEAKAAIAGGGRWPLVQVGRPALDERAMRNQLGRLASLDPSWLRLVRTCRPLSGNAARSAKPCSGQSPEGHEVVAVVADFKSGNSPRSLQRR
jgi:hypothetical protein